MTEPADAPEWLERDVFFVSDGTGITAETLGQSVLAQFDRLRVRVHRISFVDNPDKAREAVTRINDVANRHGSRPIVFSTLVDSKTNEALRSAAALILDAFGTFVVPLEQELGLKSTHTIGRFHAMSDSEKYTADRIQAFLDQTEAAVKDQDLQQAAALSNRALLLCQELNEK